MRRAVALAFVLAIVAAGLPASSRLAVAATCGRTGYPDVDDFADDAVVDRDLWNAFVASGGFANGTEAVTRVSVSVVGPTRNYTVTLDETLHVDYVGGVPTNRTTVDLRVRVEEWDGRATDWAFHGVSLGGRGGGNLALAARAEGDGLIVFWRWAYLPCDETFPNSYYVFHAAFDGAGISRDIDLVYFEAPRPRRGPPVDLILLVVAGLAVSVIFLLARHALKRNA